MTLRSSPQEDPDSEFCRQYEEAWHASGKPRPVIVEEVFAAAACGEQSPDSTLCPLWDFMRTAIERGVPLNRFMANIPGVESVNRQVLHFRLVNNSGAPLMDLNALSERLQKLIEESVQLESADSEPAADEDL